MTETSAGSGTPQYSVGSSVWYNGEHPATVTSVDDGDSGGFHYTIVTEGGGEMTAHSDDLSNRRTQLKEIIRDEFGLIKITAQTDTSGTEAFVKYNFPSYGPANISAEEARKVAESFRDGAEGLSILLDDDPEKVAESFEQAADRIEEFNSG